MKKYNIHNLVSISIDNGLENSNRIFDFLESVNKPLDSGIKCSSILVRKVKTIDKSNHREYFDGIYTSRNSIIDDKYGIEVIINGHDIILNTKFRFIEWLVYCIQLSLLKMDAVLIHGAAVSKDNKASLFPSWGGVGKTAILNDFVKKYNYQVIGDDLFILNKSGEIFSFPKTMVLYPYHKNLFPEVFKKSPSLIPTALTKQVSRLVPKVKKMLSPFPVVMNYFRNHNPQVKWAMPYEVFGSENICDKSVIKEIYWLERTTDKNTITLENKQLYSQIIGSTINEFDQRIVFCVNSIMGVGMLEWEDYLGRWYEILELGLKNSRQGRIDVNNSVSIDDIGDHIFDTLANIEDD